MIPSFSTDPFGGDGHLISKSETIETWVKEVSPGVYVKCESEWVGPILDQNQEDLANNQGKRFNDEMTRVASIPLGLYFDKIAPARKEGDQDYIKKILNDSDYSKLRVFKGNL